MNLKNTKENGESAYAKIIAENGRSFYIKEDSSLEIDIGREKKDDPNYFCLADQNTISKKHAQIAWDITGHGFFIKNLSKNKIQVNNEDLTNNSEPYRLKNMSLIVISKIRMWFLLPQDTTE